MTESTELDADILFVKIGPCLDSRPNTASSRGLMTRTERVTGEALHIVIEDKLLGEAQYIVIGDNRAQESSLNLLLGLGFYWYYFPRASILSWIVSNFK